MPQRHVADLVGNDRRKLLLRPATLVETAGDEDEPPGSREGVDLVAVEQDEVPAAVDLGHGGGPGQGEPDGVEVARRRRVLGRTVDAEDARGDRAADEVLLLRRQVRETLAHRLRCGCTDGFAMRGGVGCQRFPLLRAVLSAALLMSAVEHPAAAPNTRAAARHLRQVARAVHRFSPRACRLPDLRKSARVDSDAVSCSMRSTPAKFACGLALAVFTLDGRIETLAGERNVALQDLPPWRPSR